MYRWLRHVYPGQTRLEALLPASVVSMDIIATCAGKGEILPVCSIEGGIHSDLALFLGSDVVPVEGVQREESSRWPQDGVEASNVVGSGGGIDGRDAFVTVGDDPQSSSATIRLKLGFRLILFARTLDFARPGRLHACSGAAPHVFLEDSPNALARVQLVRFGGVDSVGISTADDGADCLTSHAKDEDDPSQPTEGGDDVASAADDDESSASSSDSGDKKSGFAEELPVPPLVLAGMGLTRQPGFEMATTLGARLQEEIVQSFSLASEPGGLEQTHNLKTSVEKLARVQREALEYSCQLSVTHEAVVALLADSTPCFDAEGSGAEHPPTTTDPGVPPGGAPARGVSDEVERDQNRILNNLIETLFAFKYALEKGVSTVPSCNRAFQATQAAVARRAERVPRRFAAVALRFLARSGDMLHACGSDPVLYSPIFPGVKALIHGVIREAPGSVGRARPDQEGAIERTIVGSLTRSMVTRVDSSSTWIFSLAALATTNPGDLPAKGWWDACITLVADRHGDKEESGCRSSRVTLAKLYKTMMAADVAASTPGEVDKQKPDQRKGELELPQSCEEGAVKSRAVVQGLAQIRELVGSWLEDEETEVSAQAIAEERASSTSSRDGDIETEDYDDDETPRHAPSLSPQRWDLGFDTSGWATDQGAAAVAALARDRGLSTGANSGADGTDNAALDSFLSTLSQLWTAAIADRTKMTAIQAAEAVAFSSDEVLRRLVFLETTMHSLFARLPGFVLCEPRRWSEWITEVRRSLSSVEEGHGDSASRRWLRFLLSHPPPLFESQTDVSGPRSSSDPSSSAEDDDSNDSDDSSTGSMSGTGRDEERDNDRPPKERSSKSGAADAVAGEPKQSEAQGEGTAHNKVRRDSRERLKFKLRLVDGQGVAGGDDGDERDVAAETKREFAARASKLFGVSTSTIQGGVTTRKAPPAAGAPGAASDNGTTVARSGASLQSSQIGPTTLVSPSLSANDDGEAGEEEEQAKFITFVAESFRPQRDESDWHREAKADPPPAPEHSPEAVSTAAIDVVQEEKVTEVEASSTGKDTPPPKEDDAAQQPPTTAVHKPCDPVVPADEGLGSSAGPPQDASAGIGDIAKQAAVDPAVIRARENATALAKDAAGSVDLRYTLYARPVFL